MVTPNPLRRLLALTGILLLLLSSSGDALGLHRCAHHDALPTADETEPAHHGHHSTPTDEDEKSEGCTCVGTCSTSTAVAMPRAGDKVLELDRVSFVAPAPASVFPEPLSAAHLLPFATAPPAL